MGVLTVVLIKINNLRDADGVGKSDPYVKFELEKDNWVFDKTLGKHQSSKKKNDCNPEYNETFEFEKVPTMNNMKLPEKLVNKILDYITSTHSSFSQQAEYETFKKFISPSLQQEVSACVYD